MKKQIEYKVGTVAVVGRPNVGKSSLINAIVGQKVSIVSGKPQTTRSEITVVFEDERGQIFMTDTPGYYQGKAVSNYNRVIAGSIDRAEAILYVVDQTRDWGEEDERIWRLVEESAKPTLLAINKSDVEGADFSHNYEILVGKHVQKVVRASALNVSHIKSIVAELFELLPVGQRDTTVDNFPSPLLSHTSKEFLAEIVREKIYQRCGAEVPYQTKTLVTKVEENEEKNRLYIDGYIIVESEHYKPMLIGANGSMISNISKAVKKELWVATGKEANVRLKVVTADELE